MTSDDNPYLRPGYHSAPTQPSGFGPVGSRPPTGGRGPGRRSVILVAALTALCVAALAVGAWLFFGGADDEGDPVAEPSASQSATPSAEPDPSDEPSAAPDDPRGSVFETPDPVVGPDWQVQTNTTRLNAFDVPPDGWNVGGNDFVVGYEILAEGEESDGIPDIAVSGTALYQEGWCPEDDDGLSFRAMAGTRSAQGPGYTSTEESAVTEADAWAVAAFDQTERGDIQVSQAEPFESAHGLVGHTATATVTGAPDNPRDACGTSEGRVVTVSYVTGDGDQATWVLVADTGHPEALDDAVIESMMSSLRHLQEG
ncbi:hypothetical protein [Streptomyces sp. PT12]|uniref:hypothetical protein n=1 Tax=Streptomyces sp. PT12 TaxID=1510197 RepID=UPI0011BDEF4C|nr:hypothetical protein [Streptomyces sp. PT12]